GRRPGEGRKATRVMPPAGRSTVESSPPEDVGRLIPVSPAVKAGVRVLVVDDERTLRESCASVLGAEGYAVTTCSRGDEALQTVQRRSFDIALVDLYMSKVLGMDLLKTI